MGCEEGWGFVSGVGYTVGVIVCRVWGGVCVCFGEVGWLCAQFESVCRV